MKLEIVRLEDRLKDFFKEQKIMKEINSICHNSRLTDDERLKQIVLIGLKEENARAIISKRYWNEHISPVLDISNTNSNIRLIRSRIAYLRNANDTDIKTYAGIGCTIEEDYPNSIIRLAFCGVLNSNDKDLLKSNGFQWSDSLGVWWYYINPNSLHFVSQYFALGTSITRIDKSAKEQEKHYKVDNIFQYMISIYTDGKSSNLKRLYNELTLGDKATFLSYCYMSPITHYSIINRLLKDLLGNNDCLGV